MSKMKHKFPHIVIGLPTLTQSKVTMNWAQGYRHIQGMLGCTSGEIIVVDETIAEARNKIIDMAIERKADYLFFLSDDVIPPSDVLVKLHQRRTDLVTGVYWTKQYPSTPYLWKEDGIKTAYMDWKLGEYFEVQYAGVDCLLIDMSIFKKLKKPYFSTNWSYFKDTPPSSFITEDFYFYEKCKHAGIKLMCDSSIQCLHENRETGEQFGLTMDMSQALPNVKNIKTFSKKKYADIRTLGQTPMRFRGKVIHRFDSREKLKPYRRTDLRLIPAESETYDYVLAENSLEYFEKCEALKLIREWMRITKIGGIFEINVPNYSEWIGDDRLFSWKSGYTKKELINLIDETTMLDKVEVQIKDKYIMLKGKVVRSLTFETIEEMRDESKIHKKSKSK